jgi:hypothetical protein
MSLRPLACWECQFESRRWHGCLSIVRVVFWQVEFSATGWSLVQRNSTECGASECDREASITGSPWPTGGLLRLWENNKLQSTACRNSGKPHNACQKKPVSRLRYEPITLWHTIPYLLLSPPPTFMNVLFYFLYSHSFPVRRGVLMLHRAS